MRSRFTKLAVLVIGLSVVTAACGRYSISSIRSLKAFQDANRYYQRGEYEAAIGRYEDAVALKPDLGFAYFFLGNSYDNLYKPARKGEPDNDAHLPKAVANYERAIEMLAGSEDPQEQEIHKLSYDYLIAAYGTDKLDDFDKAEPVARQLIALDPSEPSVYQALAKMHEDRGEYEVAEGLYLEAIDARPNDAFGYQILAGYYNRQGDFDKTMEAWYSRADVEPNNPEAWHTIGTFYQDKVFRDKALSRTVARDYVLKAVDAEDSALAINPDFAEALIYKNILLRQQALYERDPAVQQALLAEADELRDRGMAIMADRNAAIGGDDGGGDDGRGGGSL